MALLRAFATEMVEKYPETRGVMGAWLRGDAGLGPSATPDELAPPGGRFLVAYRGGRPVGCGGLKRLDESSGEVKRLYVADEARGEGLGRELLAALEGAAREAGYSAMRLDTGKEQLEAIALFLSSGYREIPDYNGNPYASLWFEKRLGSGS